MNFRRRIRLWHAPLLLGLCLQGQNFSPSANFTATTQMVLVPVTVTDHAGKTVVGLQAKDFNLFDDRAPQEILSFSNEDVPCSAGLVLDVSGSMQRVLGIAKDGAHALVQDANPEDEFLMLTVSTQPGSDPEFTSDVGDILQKVALVQPGGMTALIDTVYVGLKHMRKAHHSQRALVVFSDGMDNHSRYSETQLLNLALEADVQIYTVILDGIPGSASGGVPFRPGMIRKPGDQAAEREGATLLEKLAEKTGGLHFRARNAGEAAEAVAKIGRAMKNDYVLGYTPSVSGPAGKLHRIQVTSNVPKVYVHARNGYYAR